MDSFRGIPVEYKLDAFNMPRTGTTLCHPKIGNVDLSVIFLCFDPLTRPKMPFKVIHRKEVTHSNGSYERKSRGRKLADEIGRGKKKSHYTLIDKRIGRE